MITNYAQGHAAEKAASEYLKTLGYRTIELNWKTRWCEIDILAEKDSVIYFVEVKYRKNADQGRGLDYITPKKLQQMRFAAEMWVNSHDWEGECELAALEVFGDKFAITDLVII